MLSRLLREHLRPYAGVLLGVVALQAVQTTAALLLPTVNADIIDKGVIPGHVGYIWRLGGWMVGLSLVQLVFSSAAMFFGSRAAMGFGRDVRNRLFHQVTGFSAQEVGHFGAPSLITRITNDVQQIQILVVMACTMALAAPITMVVGIIMAVRQNIGLSVILLFSMPAAAVTLGLLVARMVPAYRVMQDRIDGINRVLREQITGIRVVRAFVREPEETQRFAVTNQELTDTALRAGRLMASMFPIVNVLVNLSSVGVLWLGADQIRTGHLEVGSIIAYLSYLIQILMSVVMATFTVSMVPRASVSAGRVMEVLGTEVSVRPPATPIRRPPQRGSVEMQGVGFHYPGAEHPVLAGISFRCPAGTTTAVIGSSGSGKTTLLNLVPRLFDATSGTVLVDGVDVRELAPEILANRIGLVPQRPYLFSGTVASNLRYGHPEASETEMWEALQICQAADFVRAMPGGLEARIEQGGANLSGGQRQRLSIARAVVRRPEVYLFDDAFSALDLATDARLRAALRPHTADSAVIVVGQRVSSISAAEQILVLEDGAVVGKGTHDELVEECPTYAEIVQSQIGEDSAA